MPAKRHALVIGVDTYPNVEDAPELRGPINDMILIYDLLTENFRFPVGNVTYLGNWQATQAEIRAAMERMLGRVRKDDIVVCFYSGHGSRMKVADGWSETIVPYDSGRKPHPNRDIRDLEIDRWVQRLNRKTPYVTLIFDCCFSGSVTRDPWGQPVRRIEDDRRLPEEMFDEGELARSLSPSGGRRGAARSGFRFVPGRRKAMMIAASRADEESGEVTVGRYAFGALTYYLARALERAGRGATWRDVFEQVGPAVTARYEHQHPQIEGNWNEVLFGRREIRPASYLKVDGVQDGAVRLAGGAAHGVSRGSIWTVHPAGARRAVAAQELARVRIQAVEAVSAEARIVKAKEPKQLTGGQRAFLRKQRLPKPGLKVLLAGKARDSVKLRKLIESSPLLQLTTRRPADVLVRLVPRRAEVGPQDPCPNLGPLRKPTWAAIGSDGRLAVETRPASAPQAENLVGDLESLARFWNVLAIENDRASTLDGRVRLVLKRWNPRQGRFVTARPKRGDGVVSFEDGERLNFEIRNLGKRRVWITLLLFDSDRSIQRLVPSPDIPNYSSGGYPLEGKETLSVQEYYRRDPQQTGQVLRLNLPPGFPWAVEPGESRPSGLARLKLMVTLEKADFEVVEQQRLRPPRDPGMQGHPLLQLARFFSVGKGSRDFSVRAAGGSRKADWTTVTRPIDVRRR